MTPYEQRLNYEKQIAILEKERERLFNEYIKMIEKLKHKN